VIESKRKVDRMPQKAIDRSHVWPLLDSVTRSYATNDLQRRADALIAALVYAFEAIEILEARVAQLENERGPDPSATKASPNGERSE
jgi:hypothetical protein